jgi:hypothetical protein
VSKPLVQQPCTAVSSRQQLRIWAASTARVDLPLQVPGDVSLILLLEVLTPPVLPGDDPAAVLGPAVAWHLIRVVVRGRPIMGELLARLDVAHRHEDDLALHADVRVARVVAEDHAAFPLIRGEGSDEKAFSDGDLRRTEGRFDFAQGGGVKDVAPLIATISPLAMGSRANRPRP